MKNELVLFPYFMLERPYFMLERPYFTLERPFFMLQIAFLLVPGGVKEKRNRAQIK